MAPDTAAVGQGARPESFKLLIDQQMYSWSRASISGREIKQLASVDPSYGVWREVPGPTDPAIGDDEQAPLDGHGVERFFTGKKTTTEGGE